MKMCMTKNKTVTICRETRKEVGEGTGDRDGRKNGNNKGLVRPAASNL